MIRRGLRLVFLLVLLSLLTAWVVIRPTIFAINDLSSARDSTMATGADAKRLETLVYRLVNDFGRRGFDTPHNLDRVAGFIHSQLEMTGARVSRQTFDLQEGLFQNVVAEYGPDSESILVVGAHYDAADGLPGADDNASGVAGLLELGRLLAQAALKQRVILVGFTLEEPPFFGSDAMGSAVYADALNAQGIDVELMISLEMIGYFVDEPGTQDYPFPLMRWVYPDRGNFIAVVDRLFSDQARALRETFRHATTLPAWSFNAPAFMEGVHFSDHRNFWHHDYPAVMVTDTAYLRNRAYHTPGDTPERLDYERMAEVVNGVYSHLLSLQ